MYGVWSLGGRAMPCTYIAILIINSNVPINFITVDELTFCDRCCDVSSCINLIGLYEFVLYRHIVMSFTSGVY